MVVENLITYSARYRTNQVIRRKEVTVRLQATMRAMLTVAGPHALWYSFTNPDFASVTGYSRAYQR